jgi:hypothetical protein
MPPFFTCNSSLSTCPLGVEGKHGITGMSLSSPGRGVMGYLTHMSQLATVRFPKGARDS